MPPYGDQHRPLEEIAGFRALDRRQVCISAQCLGLVEDLGRSKLKQGTCQRPVDALSADPEKRSIELEFLLRLTDAAAADSVVILDRPEKRESGIFESLITPAPGQLNVGESLVLCRCPRLQTGRGTDQGLRPEDSYVH